MEAPNLMEVLVSLVVVLLLLFGLRSFMLWFFGIGRALRLLESIDRKLGPPIPPEEYPEPPSAFARILAVIGSFRRRKGAS